MRWIDRILADQDNMTVYAECMAHFEAEYAKSVKELGDLTRTSSRVVSAAGKLPMLTTIHYANQKELEIINRFIEERIKYLKGKHHKKYREHYQRANLTATDIDRYIDAEDDVWELKRLQHRFAAVMQQYSSIMAGLEKLHFQITNISRLRAAGVEDALFD